MAQQQKKGKATGRHAAKIKRYYSKYAEKKMRRITKNNGKRAAEEWYLEIWLPKQLKASKTTK